MPLIFCPHIGGEVNYCRKCRMEILELHVWELREVMQEACWRRHGPLSWRNQENVRVIGAIQLYFELEFLREARRAQYA